MQALMRTARRHTVRQFRTSIGAVGNGSGSIQRQFAKFENQWRSPEGHHLGLLRSPNGLVTPGSKRTDDLSKCLEPRTNTQRLGAHLKRMLLTQQQERKAPSLPPNQPMERTLPRCALQRRSSARWADAVRIVQL